MSNFDKLTKNLHPKDKDFLLSVYHRHIATMGTDAKKNYTIDKIKSVKVNTIERAFEVRYTNGDFWYYAFNGTWY